MDFLNNDSPKTETPKSITVELKEHQKTSLYQCMSLEDGDISVADSIIRSRVGILSDNVGSGKSLTILSLIAEKSKLTKTKYMCNYASTMGLVNNFTVDQTVNAAENMNIIIVPHHITTQWENYIKDNTTLDYYIVKSKKTLGKMLETGFPTILVLSSSWTKEFYKNHYNLNFSRVIIDEADVIKVSAFPKFRATFYWFITSSYQNLIYPRGQIKYVNDSGEISDIYNWDTGFRYTTYIGGLTSTGFIKTVFYDICSHLNVINKLIVINDDDFIKQSFTLLSPIINMIRCNDPNLYKILDGIVNQDILNKINAGDIKAAIKSMKCVKTGEENLVCLATQELKINLNNLKIKFDSTSQMIYASDTSKDDALEKINKSIIETEKKIESINSRLTDNFCCTICYDEPENRSIAKCCNQTFCVECITIWLAKPNINNCPFCRTQITSENLIVVSDNMDDKLEMIEPTKNQAFKNLLQDLINKPDSKILVFTEFDGSFNKIMDTFEYNSMIPRYSYVKGSGASITKTIIRYRQKNDASDSIQMLLLNSRFFGSGMNLENTTDIIIYHNMNDGLNKQIIGRAQRPGRTTQLNVWRLCNQNETNKDFVY